MTQHRGAIAILETLYELQGKETVTKEDLERLADVHHEIVDVLIEEIEHWQGRALKAESK